MARGQRARRRCRRSKVSRRRPAGHAPRARRGRRVCACRARSNGRRRPCVVVVVVATPNYLRQASPDRGKYRRRYVDVQRIAQACEYPLAKHVPTSHEKVPARLGGERRDRFPLLMQCPELAALMCDETRDAGASHLQISPRSSRVQRSAGPFPFKRPGLALESGLVPLRRCPQRQRALQRTYSQCRPRCATLPHLLSVVRTSRRPVCLTADPSVSSCTARKPRQADDTTDARVGAEFVALVVNVFRLLLGLYNMLLRVSK